MKLTVILIFLSVSLLHNALAQSVGVSPDFIETSGEDRLVRVYNINSHDTTIRISDSPFEYIYDNSTIAADSYKDIILKVRDKKEQEGTILIKLFSESNLATAAAVNYRINSQSKHSKGYIASQKKKPELEKRMIGTLIMISTVAAGLACYKLFKSVSSLLRRLMFTLSLLLAFARRILK